MIAEFSTDIADFNSGRGGSVITFKDGTRWYLRIEDGFTPEAHLVVSEQ